MNEKSSTELKADLRVKRFLQSQTNESLRGIYTNIFGTDEEIVRQRERSALLVGIDLKNQRSQQNAQLRIQAAEAQCRTQFADIASQLGVSNTDTNFKLVWDPFNGTLMDIEDIKDAISRGQLNFIPATDEELAETETLESRTCGTNCRWSEGPIGLFDLPLPGISR